MDPYNLYGNNPNPRRFGCAQILALALAIAAGLWLFSCISCASCAALLQGDDDTPYYNDEIAAIRFSSFTDFSVEIDVGDEETGYFEIIGDGDYHLSDIKLVSSDESIAKFEIDDYIEWVGYIYYKIIPVSDGTATLYVQSKDGSVRSKEITVNVTDPNNFSYEIVDTYYNIGTSSIGTVWIECYAIVENTGSTNLYLSSGSFDIEDKDGNLVDIITTSTVYPIVIAPGERAVYYENAIWSDHTDGKEYNIVPKVDIMRATVPHIRYEVSDVTLSEDKTGDITVIGRVTNHTEFEETLCWIAILFYNSDNELIAVDSCSTAEDLSPGGTASFKTSQLYDYFGVDLEDVAHYEIIAYPYQHQLKLD